MDFGFLLDPSVTFVNHGSFGATPRLVFQAYQRWQRELECRPVDFLGRRFYNLMKATRSSLADYLETNPNYLVFTTNVIEALNIVAHTLDLGLGNEVLHSDHEYGALDRTWRFLAREWGFPYMNQPIQVPMTSRDAFVNSLWKGVTPHTRVIFLSHISSPTALIWSSDIGAVGIIQAHLSNPRVTTPRRSRSRQPLGDLSAG